MIAQSVAEIIGRHVRRSVEGIDRMYLNVFAPGLQTRGEPFASSASIAASHCRRRL